MMYRCPKCKSVELEVVVKVWATLKQDGPGAFETDTSTPQDGSHDWDEESLMMCHKCQHCVPVSAFQSADWAECSAEKCDAIIEQPADYFASPCGTYCPEHMAEHALSCEICSDEFGLPLKDDIQAAMNAERRFCLTPDCACGLPKRGTL